MTNKKKNRKKISGDAIFGIILSAVVVVLMAVFLLNLDKMRGDEPDKKTMTVNTEETVEITTENKPYLGDETATVTIVEYGDYKCPHCSEFALTTYPKIAKSLIETGKAKFVFKNYAFMGEDSITAAAYASSVNSILGEESYWEFHEGLFKEQNKVYLSEVKDGVVFTEESLYTVAKNLFGKASAEKVKKDFEENLDKYVELVKKDSEEAIKNGVTGTPSVFINGVKVPNPFDIENVESNVEYFSSNSSEEKQ